MTAGRLRPSLLLPTLTSLSIAGLLLAPTLARGATSLTEKPGERGIVKPNPIGGLDCNGHSPIQQRIKITYVCADPHNPTSDDGRFEDNGFYIGHDEPDLNFLSDQRGSGNNVTWNFTIPRDPTAAPTTASPGHDVSHWFELTPAFWFSMGICDPQSYPILPCTPKSDQNAPSGRYPGAGSAFMELQLYPPGFAPWIDSVSVDNKHWAAALNIDSAEVTAGFTNINPDCEEPVNFAWIQRNGVPTGPPSPQLQNFQSNTPNAHTLLMNPGDQIRVHIWDAPVPDGSGKALVTRIEDLTTGQAGYMQASAANGFMNTSIVDCSGTPFNFEPEYSRANLNEVTPWGAGTEVISASVETGHFEPCTSLSDKESLFITDTISDTAWATCSGRYENSVPGSDADNPELSDEPCYPAGDQHGKLAAGSPNEVTGCDVYDIGDLDYDGTAYWKNEWPRGAAPTATLPGAFQLSPPTTGASNSPYQHFEFQTDLGFNEVTTCDPGTPNGCTVPPPNAPDQFYPFWTLAGSGASCSWEFGQAQNGKGFGGMSQYGTVTTNPALFPEINSKLYKNTCTN